MKWSGNYKDHICAITIKNATSEDAGRWRCEVESYARGKYRGYGYNVTSEFYIKFIPKATITTSMEDKNTTIIFSQRNSIIAGTGAALCGTLGIIVNIMAIIMVLKQPKVEFFCEID